MSKKQFILGVGCHKGGTTWLSSQLKKSPSVDLGLLKEYHVFDALYVPECRDFLGLPGLQKRKIFSQALRKRVLLQQLPCLIGSSNFRKQPANYFSYFYALSQGPGITTVGDITPSYAALPVAALSQVKQKLEDIDFAVKVVFLMRDPIERCWSAVRMNRRNNQAGYSLQESEQAQLERFYSSKAYEIRTRYEVTISNLEEVFHPKQVYYGIYERMFSHEATNKLKDFLGVKGFAPDRNMRINATPKREGWIDECLQKQIYSFYRKTYALCEERFDVKKVWRSF